MRFIKYMHEPQNREDGIARIEFTLQGYIMTNLYWEGLFVRDMTIPLSPSNSWTSSLGGVFYGYTEVNCPIGNMYVGGAVTEMRLGGGLRSFDSYQQDIDVTYNQEFHRANEMTNKIVNRKMFALGVGHGEKQNT